MLLIVPSKPLTFNGNVFWPQNYETRGKYCTKLPPQVVVANCQIRVLVRIRTIRYVLTVNPFC